MRASKLAGACVLLALGCASGGQWGHSRNYDPLSEEEDATERAVAYDPVMAERRPKEWGTKSVHLFGVVVDRQSGPGGLTDLTLSMRALETRNLCETAEEDSCRVTVSDREHSRLHALVQLRPEDELGEQAVGAQSLLRLVGKLSPEVSGADGLPVIRASYYRHWPRNYYVTSAARSYMLR